MFAEEENNNMKKHSALFTVLSIFVVIVTITGIAVAAYTWNYTSTHGNTIGTGNIALSLLESNDVFNLANSLPISDKDGVAASKNNAFDFAVTTNASGAPGDINYRILLKKEPSNNGYTALPDNNIKVYLTVLDKNGEIEVMKPTLVSKIITNGTEGTLSFNTNKTSYLIHSHIKNDSTKTTKYRLRMWIDENTDASNWTANNRYEYKVKIGVSGNLAT